MSELDAIVGMLRAVSSKDIERRIAARAAELLGDALATDLDAGRAPDGPTWLPAKKGGKAYKNASKKLSVVALGNLVRATITGPEVYGHFGNKRMPVRRMLPDAGAAVPPEVVAAITEAARQVLSEIGVK